MKQGRGESRLLSMGKQLRAEMFAILVLGATGVACSNSAFRLPQGKQEIAKSGGTLPSALDSQLPCGSTPAQNPSLKLAPGKYTLDCKLVVEGDLIVDHAEITIKDTGYLLVKGAPQIQASERVFNFPDLEYALSRYPLAQRWGVYPAEVRGGRVEFLTPGAIAIQPEWFGAKGMSVSSIQAARITDPMQFGSRLEKGLLVESSEAWRLAVRSIPNGGTISPRIPSGQPKASWVYRWDQDVAITQNNVKLDFLGAIVHSVDTRSSRIWCVGDYLGKLQTIAPELRWEFAIKDCAIKNAYIGSPHYLGVLVGGQNPRDPKLGLQSVLKGPYCNWALRCSWENLIKTGNTATSLNMFACRDCKVSKVFNNGSSVSQTTIGLLAHQTINLTVDGLYVNVDPQNMDSAWVPASMNKILSGIQLKGSVGGKVSNSIFDSFGGNDTGIAHGIFSRGDRPWQYLGGTSGVALRAQMAYQSVPHSLAYMGKYPKTKDELCGKDNREVVECFSKCIGDSSQDASKPTPYTCQCAGEEYTITGDRRRTLRLIEWLLFGKGGDPFNYGLIGNWCGGRTDPRIKNVLDLVSWAVPDHSRATSNAEFVDFKVRNLHPVRRGPSGLRDTLTNGGSAGVVIESVGTKVVRPVVLGADKGFAVLRPIGGHERGISIENPVLKNISSVAFRGFNRNEFMPEAVGVVYCDPSDQEACAPSFSSSLFGAQAFASCEQPLGFESGLKFTTVPALFLSEFFSSGCSVLK